MTTFNTLESPCRRLPRRLFAAAAMHCWWLYWFFYMHKGFAVSLFICLHFGNHHLCSMFRDLSQHLSLCLFAILRFPSFMWLHEFHELVVIHCMSSCFYLCFAQHGDIQSVPGEEVFMFSLSIKVFLWWRKDCFLKKEATNKSVP